MAPPERREQLLDAALHVFVTQGASAFNIESVAREAGVTRPVVYDFFANAIDLMHELVKREEAHALAEIAEVMPSVGPSGDLAAMIADAAKAFLEAVERSPERWTVIVMPPHGTAPVVTEHIERGRAAVIGQIEQLIRQGLEARKGPDLDVPVAARTVVAVGETAARLVITEGDEFTPERLAKFVSSAVMALLRA
jgi:AcrR family transcriptional regulator